MAAAWFADYQANCAMAGVMLSITPQAAPFHVGLVAASDWGTVAAVAHAQGCRWCGLWGEDCGSVLRLNAVLEKHGHYLLLRTLLDTVIPLVASHTPYFPAADRLERHAHDLLGIRYLDHPDTRRWTRHHAWRQGEYPLRWSYPRSGYPPHQTPPDYQYPFLQAHGSGVYEIPVGPIHAGIIESGHFRFEAVGEHILNLEERLGYVHKGIEKIAVGRDATSLARLAGRVSGDSTVAHSWAACMAMERAAALDLPPRAVALRAVLAERERIANHLGDVGAICNDVGFAFIFYQFGRLREQWTRRNNEIFGHRLLMDRVIPGGVCSDVNAQHLALMAQDGTALRAELPRLRDIIETHSLLQDRILTTGILTHQLARELGCLGYVGRASGHSYDLRRDAPYPPYHALRVSVPSDTAGDVNARLRVRLDEIHIALDLLDQLLSTLPEGEILIPWQAPVAGAEGIGVVEGWRGETLAHVVFGDTGQIIRYFPRDPSVFNWPALEKLIRDNIVPDFPVCNKSVNGSYSGCDL